MKKVISISGLLIVLFASVCQAAMAKPDSRRAAALVSLLQEFQQREDVTPDNFFDDVRTLRREIAVQTDSASKAIYQATLAHLLHLNAHRGQGFRRETASHPDSLQEWSTLEYEQHAARLYALALKDMPLLHATPTQDWLPLVKKGRDEAVFASDMLYVIWQAYQNDLGFQRLDVEGLPTYAQAISVYEASGHTEAVIRLKLDSVCNTPRENMLEPLTHLRQEYQGAPACALIYLREAEQLWEPREKKELLEEALRLYPGSAQKNALQNLLLQLEEPVLSCEFNNPLYPGRDMKLHMQVRNMQSARFTLYSLPIGFKPSDRGSLLEQVKKAGRLTDVIQHRFAEHPAYEQWDDTLHYTAPECGVYAIVMQGTTPARLQKAPQPQVCLLRTSRLSYFYMDLPNDSVRVVTVDALTGHPLSGVTVELMTRQPRSNEYKLWQTLTSDARGFVHFTSKGDRGDYKIRLFTPTDQARETQQINTTHGRSVDPVRRPLHIYTDRSIYRPGQTVFVGALAYTEKGWDARVEQGKDYTLTLYDANNQKVATHQLKSDEMGMLADSVALPEKSLPGQYRVQIAGTTAWFSVEEYRRPTFRVELTERGQAEIEQDSITITGHATAYSGAPIAGGRVTARYAWGTRMLSYMGERHMTLPDTVYTDAKGNFRLRIPYQEEQGPQTRGRMLRVNVDVLSPTGETQMASQRMGVCTEPLSLWVEAFPDMQDKGKLQPWHFGLCSKSQAKVEADVLCRVRQDDREVCSFTVPAGRKTVPAQLADIPSGLYQLRAEVKVGSDTTSLELPFTLISMDDKRPASYQELRLYTNCDTFDLEKPVRIQFGSSLQDAWLFCTMTADNGLCLDTVVHLSDALQTWEIPYKKEYGQGAHFIVSLYHDGKLQVKRRTLRLREPDIALRLRWDTFRDHLRPGQQEEWRLTLTRPDGQPAQANVLLSLYDASLDAIRPHDIGFRRTLHHFVQNYSVSAPWSWDGRMHLRQYFQQRFLQYKEKSFSGFDERYFQGVMNLRAGMYGAKRMKMAGNVVDEANVMDGLYGVIGSSSAASRAVMSVAPTAAVAGGMAEVVEAEDDAAAETLDAGSGGALENMDVALRTNLSELVFFRPMLRTDAQGQVSIAFTLPDGLTSWHLQGFAHTADLMSVGIDETIVAQKELMAELQLPRFLRHGDEAVLTASLRNISDLRQEGEAEWIIQDASQDGKPLKRLRVRFALEAQTDTVFFLPFSATMEHPLLAVKWMAKSQDCSDGEQRLLPVLSDAERVTNTKAFFVTDDEQKTVDLQKLFPGKNATDKVLTVEYVNNPMQLAVQCLPSLMAPVRDDVLSLATAYYAGVLGYHLAHSLTPRAPSPEGEGEKGSLMHGYTLPLALWRGGSGGEAEGATGGEAFSLLLQETPWVLEAEQEKARRERLATFFQEVEQENRRMAMLNALGTLQMDDGSFAWFPGMRGSSYMTTEVAYLMTRLQLMTGQSSVPERQLLDKAISYLVKQLETEVSHLRKQKEPHVGLNDLRTLYIIYRSGYKQTKQAAADVNYLLSLLRKDAKDFDREERALAAIVLQAAGEQKRAQELMPRLHHLLGQPDGTYLAYPGGSFTSIDRKLQAHVQLMEAVRLVEPADTTTLNGMAQWLIQQKRTQEWEQPALTANAIYALLAVYPQSSSAETKPQSRVVLEADGKSRVMSQPESPDDILRERLDDVRRPKSLKVEHHGKGVSWGAVYAQFTQPATDVSAQQEGLNIRREINSSLPTGEGEGRGFRGSRIHVRYTITADRDYEFVRLSAPRPASAEPTTQLSGYRYQNGVGYYQAIHDASTEYFMDSLPRGTYVIEEDWLLTSSGTYVQAPAKIQCLYAPEYGAHTAGGKFSVK